MKKFAIEVCRPHSKPFGIALSPCGFPAIFGLRLVWVHRKKRFTSFPSQAWMSLTKLPLGRNNSVMTSLFPPRESLESSLPAGDGKLANLFLRCCRSAITSKYISKLINLGYSSAYKKTTFCVEWIQYKKLDIKRGHFETKKIIYVRNTCVNGRTGLNGFQN